MKPPSRVVIIGAGQAGAGCALAMRELGYEGMLTLVGDEPEAPYERPPLSKAMLGVDAEAARIHLHEPARYAQAGIDLLLGRSALRVLPSTREIELDDGRTLTYDRCIIATGGRARAWPGRVHGNGGRVLTLRSLAHARTMRERLRRARSLIVIGGGFLGLECATAARALGIEVIVLESRDTLLPDKLPAALARRLMQRHVEQGVRFRCAARIDRIIDETGDPLRVCLADGEECGADVCLVAIGQLPNIELAEQAGIETDGGILVDRFCRTSAPGVYAAGDCVSFPFGSGARRVRIESWQNAQEQSRVAAANALGIETPYSLLPWFWTDQAGWNMQFIGLENPQAPDLQWIVRDTSTGDAVRCVWIGSRRGVPVAAVAVNSGADITPLRRLISRAKRVQDTVLADSSLRLARIVQALDV